MPTPVRPVRVQQRSVARRSAVVSWAANNNDAGVAIEWINSGGDNGGLHECRCVYVLLLVRLVVIITLMLLLLLLVVLLRLLLVVLLLLLRLRLLVLLHWWRGGL